MPERLTLVDALPCAVVVGGPFAVTGEKITTAGLPFKVPGTVVVCVAGSVVRPKRSPNMLGENSAAPPVPVSGSSTGGSDGPARGTASPGTVGAAGKTGTTIGTPNVPGVPGVYSASGAAARQAGGGGGTGGAASTRSTARVEQHTNRRRRGCIPTLLVHRCGSTRGSTAVYPSRVALLPGVYLLFDRACPRSLLFG